MKNISNRFDPSEVEGISQLTWKELDRQILNMDTLFALMDTIKYYQSMINSAERLINNMRLKEAIQYRDFTVHNIDIYSRCIARLKQRYNKVLEDLKFEG